MDNKIPAESGPHKLLLQGRKTVELTGVKEVVSFDAKEVVLNTTMGALLIRGDELFVKRLTVEKGEVDLEGRVDSFIYTDKPGKAGEGDSLLKRLFR
ncbi:MAG: sporulation protein YabP [Lachnospiraceae bacterium]|nr:sporulation protein YabP [Lachnospiraceae bacterium]